MNNKKLCFMALGLGLITVIASGCGGHSATTPKIIWVDGVHECEEQTDFGSCTWTFTKCLVMNEPLPKVALLGDEKKNIPKCKMV